MLQPGCNLGRVRPDVAFVRADNEYAALLQFVILEGSREDRFAAIFNGTATGKFMSPSTVRLERYDEDTDTYLGPLMEMLDQFQAVAQQQQSDQAANIADLVCSRRLEQFRTAAEWHHVGHSAVSHLACEHAPACVQAPSSGSGGGVPAWGVAVLIFGALAAGIVGGLFVQKWRNRHSSPDTFYQGACSSFLGCPLRQHLLQLAAGRSVGQRA